MLRVALTGGMGSGKSYVARHFEALGVPVFYADEAAKVLYKDPVVIREIDVITGGKAIQDNGGAPTISLATLSNLIFQDSEIRRRVEAVIHPRVHRRFEAFCRDHADKPYILSEAALYFETGRWKDFDAVILVTAPLEQRLQRLKTYRGISPEEALKRIATQWPDEQKIPLATFHIVNDDKHNLDEQVKAIHNALLLKAAQP